MNLIIFPIPRLLKHVILKQFLSRRPWDYVVKSSPKEG